MIEWDGIEHSLAHGIVSSCVGNIIYLTISPRHLSLSLTSRPLLFSFLFTQASLHGDELGRTAFRELVKTLMKERGEPEVHARGEGTFPPSNSENLRSPS